MLSVTYMCWWGNGRWSQMKGTEPKIMELIHRGLWMRRIQCCFISFHYMASTRPVLFKKCKCDITPIKTMSHSHKALLA